MQKGDYLLSSDGKNAYQIVGRCGRDVVMAIVSEESDEVLVYGAAELEGLISTGNFRKLHRTGIKVNEEGGMENE
jgi:hypothetical protein